MTEPQEPVTLRQIFSAIQGLRADVQALTTAHEQTRKALVSVGDEQTRIAKAQLDFGNEIGARVHDVERRLDRGEALPNGGA